MKRIPLYDATEPIACSIDAEEVPARLALVERLRDRLGNIERSEHGLLLRYAADPGVEADLRRFAVDEKRCCAFWGFEVDADGDELTLRWDGPPTADEILDRLLTWFEGDGPLAGVIGLL